MYDLLIVGSGPAALSCAITARKRDLKVLIAGANAETGWLWKTDRIDNYPGMPAVSGKEMLRVFKQQALDAGAEMVTGVVRQIQPMGKRGFMALIGNDILQARAIALCMGAARPKLLPGEEEMLGSGVSWCGTCDGMFYRGKNVAVLSYWHGGIEEGVFLSGLAAKTDYYVIAPHQLPDEPPFHVVSGRPASLSRENGKIVLHTDEGDRAYDGVFIFRPAVAPDQMVPKLDLDGVFIHTDREMRTSVPMIYAAGDCTGQPLQIAKAVGEGNIAAITCAAELSKS